MFKNYVFLFLLLTFIPTQSLAQTDDHAHHDHTEHMQDPELVVTPILPKELKPNENNDVILYIQNKNAEPMNISDFNIVHTEPIHLLIIEPGLSDYHHKHPIQKGPGQYAFSFTPQTACSYQIWVDVYPKESHKQIIPVDLKGSEQCNDDLNKASIYETTVEDYVFKIEIEGSIKAGEELLASMSIHKDQKHIENLKPLMGAFTHLVGFYDNYKTIAHIHPMGEEPTQDSNRGESPLKFHINLEKSGYLKLFAQVKIGNKEYIVPFGLVIE